MSTLCGTWAPNSLPQLFLPALAPRLDEFGMNVGAPSQTAALSSAHRISLPSRISVGSASAGVAAILQTNSQ
jgi:hypothetical protein